MVGINLQPLNQILCDEAVRVDLEVARVTEILWRYTEVPHRRAIHSLLKFSPHHYCSIARCAASVSPIIIRTGTTSFINHLNHEINYYT